MGYRLVKEGKVAETVAGLLRHCLLLEKLSGSLQLKQLTGAR